MSEGSKVKQSLIYRSGSIVMGTKHNIFIQQSLNKPYEVTQLQRIFEKATALLTPLVKRLNRAPKFVRLAFTFDKFIAFNTVYEGLRCKMVTYNSITDFYTFLCDPSFLLIAYDNVKKNIMVGFDTVRRNNVTLFALCILSKKLVTTEYTYFFAQKLQENTKLFNMQDKIVQKALQMWLQLIFGNRFNRYFDEFFFNKNSHTVLNAICKANNKTIWFIKLHLKKVSDLVCHPFYKQEIKTKTSDLQMINFVFKIVKRMSVNPHSLSNKKVIPSQNILPKNIIASFFVNMLYNRFDCWIKINLLPEFNKCNKDSLNLEYENMFVEHFES